MFARAAERDKRPIIIDAISDTQRMKLHGEELLTSAVSVRGNGLAQQDTMYFVAKPDTTGLYLSGPDQLLVEIEQKGFDAVSKEIDETQKEIANEHSPSPSVQ